MGTEDKYSERLLKRNIKPTSIRLLVLKSAINYKSVFSLADLEMKLETVDKSTIFRTLTLFQQQRLVHSIDDGSGSLKYAVCDEDCDCKLDQLHVHFLCTKCNRTFCMREKAIPVIKLPDGFIVDSINYVIKGMCERCSKIAT